MKHSPYCRIGSQCYTKRFEILGFILILIATLLTIKTHSDAGIIILFLLGIALFAHNFWSCGSHLHSGCCHSEECSHTEDCKDNSHEDHIGCCHSSPEEKKPETTLETKPETKFPE